MEGLCLDGTIARNLAPGAVRLLQPDAEAPGTNAIFWGQEPASAGGTRHLQHFRHPTLNRHAHLAQMAFEKMISGNEHQFLGLSGLRYHFFQQRVWPILIVIAADE